MTQKVLLADPKKCTGCGLCRVACALHHEGVCSPARSRVRVIQCGEAGPFLPVTCQHCESAPCASVCPVSAIGRDADNVRTVIDYNLCVGCRMCVYACPFGAMGFDADRGRPFKCDLCGGDPLCVQFCTPGALTFADATALGYRQLRTSALMRSVAGGNRQGPVCPDR